MHVLRPDVGNRGAIRHARYDADGRLLHICLFHGLPADVGVPRVSVGRSMSRALGSVNYSKG